MKKIVIIIYSVLAYFLSVAALLYIIGFIGNVVVPKSIDSGIATGFTQSFFIDLLLVILFAVQHSAMARPAFKKWWIRIIGSVAERSTYLLFTSLALFFICWRWQPMPAVIWKIDNNSIAAIITGIYFLGWLIVFLSTFMINHFELFGLKQAFENAKGRHPANAKFTKNLFYRFVRHPIMLGLLIALWATPFMTLGHLLFSITTTLYILLAVKMLEEKDLRDVFGKEYEAYQKNTPMVIPFSRTRKNA